MKTQHLILLGLLATSAPALAFNPLDWFRSDREVDYTVPTREERREAARLFEEAIALREAGEKNACLSTLRVIILDYSNTPTAADALFMRGQIEMEDGSLKDAFETFQKIVNRYPGYEQFNAVVSNQFAIATRYMEGERGRIFWVLPGFREPSTAIEYFEVVIKNAPYSEYAPLALMNIALTAEDKGDKELAIDALDRLITFYPESLLAEDAYFALAQVYAGLIQGPAYDQGTTLEAMNYLEDFIILFPNSGYIREAEADLRAVREIFAQSKLLVAEFYYVNRNDTKAALVFYNETITVAPTTEAADIARRRIARIEEGRPRPTLKEKPATEDLRKSVDEFFDRRWEQLEIEDLEAVGRGQS